MPLSEEQFSKIDSWLEERESRKIYVARERESGKIVAAIYVVWDTSSAYLLATGRVEENTDGALSLLIWQAIRDMSARVKRFDFEGSMIPEVEHYFRAFGGALKPYFRIGKASKLIEPALLFRRIFRGIS